MNATVAKRDATEVTLLIQLTAADLVSAQAQTFERLRGQVKAPGFRPGKAPDAVVTRQLGDAVVQSEVLETAVMNSYAAAVKQHQLPVLARPDIKVKKFVPYTELEYEAQVDIIPDIKVADLTKLRKAKPEVTVEPAEIDQVITDLRRRLAQRQAVKRAAQLGDEVKIDFKGQRDGQAVAGASGQNYTLALGSGTFIPGFEEQLVGLTAGSDKTFTITFPADYSQPDLAGRPVEFKVHLREVQELQLPAIDDALADQAAGVKTLAALRADIEQRLRADKQDKALQVYEQELLDEVVAGSKFAIPQRLLAQQLERLKSELGQNLSSSGLDLEKYLQMRSQTMAQLEEELKPQAERRAGLALVLSRIAQDEKLSVSEAEVETELARLQAAYHDAELQTELKRPETREEIYNHLLSSKVIAKITEYAQARTKEKP